MTLDITKPNDQVLVSELPSYIREDRIELNSITALSVGPQGNQGSQGPQGNQGHQGFQGPADGPQGPQGAGGVQGPQGINGNQGAQGSIGTQGNQGHQGVIGSQGYQGTSGAQGSQGVQGNQGFQGSQGAQGSQGSQGNQGNQGFQGDIGSQGYQGNQGTQGSTGLGVTWDGGYNAGTTYDQGDGVQFDDQLWVSLEGTNIGNQPDTSPTKWELFAGTQGPQGDAGAQGAQGPQGNIGSQGATGTQGNQGTQGATGATGAQGPQGNTGSQGAVGVQGASGTQGPQGQQGVIGPQGNVGSQGAIGNQGYQGNQGSTGSQGVQGVVGAQGATGSQGTQGPQGAQGLLGDTLSWEVSVTSDGGLSFAAGADLTLTGDDSDPAKIIFRGAAYSTEMYASRTGHAFYINPVTSRTLVMGTSGQLWDQLTMYSGDIDMFGYFDYNDYAQIEISGGDGDSSIHFKTSLHGSLKELRYLGTYLTGTADHQLSLGYGGDYAFNYIYCYDLQEGLDLLIMDTLDDLKVIHDIKGSGKIDSATGFEIIDDDTVHASLISRYQEDMLDIFGEDKTKILNHKGDIIRDSQGRPYSANRVIKSLLMGAVKQLDKKYEQHMIDFHSNVQQSNIKECL